MQQRREQAAAAAAADEPHAVPEYANDSPDDASSRSFDRGLPDETAPAAPFPRFSFALCKLCLRTLRNPVTTPCGHNFCQECLGVKMRAMGDEARRCPQCMFPLRNLCPVLRVNMQLAALVAVVGGAADGQPDALRRLVREVALQDGADTGFDDPRLLRRVVEGACMSEIDLRRLKAFADALRLRLEEIVARRRVIEAHLPPGLQARAGTASDLCPGEASIVWNYGVCAQARRVFAGLDHARPYNLIVVPTRGEDFAGDALTALLRLPMYGIAAVRTVIVVGCRPHDLGDVVAQVIPAWGAEYGSVVATWATDVRGEVPRTVMWVAAYIGPVQSLQTRREGRGVYALRAAPAGSDIPLALLARFNSMFPAYTSCCLLGQKQVVPGWVSPRSRR